MDAPLLKKLFREMLRIRMVEEKIAEVYPEQEMRCPVHLCTGQEAVAVGVCAHLGKNDYVLSSHRSHGHYLAKGGNLKALLAELYGKETGCSHGKGGSMHLVDLAVGFLGSTPIVGSTIPIGVGAAFGSVLRNEKRLVAIFFGEGATEEGVFHESLNFAVLKNLPVIFICENNLYSVYSPLEVRQPQRKIHELVRGNGLGSSHGDGNDVTEVWRLIKEAVGHVQSGKGPAFLEFDTYRWREHCGPHYDNQLGYRTEQEFLEWKKRCPVNRCKERLLEGGISTAREIIQMEKDLANEIDEAFLFAKESPFPPAESILQHIYAA